MRLVFNIVQLSFQRGGDHGPGIGQVHTLAHAVPAATPAGVDHPHVYLVLRHLLPQHLGILTGVEGEEGRAKTGAEGALGFIDARLGAGNLGGVPADELVHGLPGRELADGRKHPVTVAGKKENIFRQRTNRRLQGIADKVQGIAHPRIGRDGLASEIQVLFAGDKGHILHDGARAHSPVNLRLLVFREVDGFGIAATLKIENGIGRPPMLIIANQAAVGIGAERGFTRAAQSEENSRIAVLAQVGGAVHAQHAFVVGQHIIQHRENAFLHFAGITGAADQDYLFREVHDGEVVLADAVFRAFGMEAGGLDDVPVGLKAIQFFLLRPQEHIMAEEVAPGIFVHHADIHPVGRVGAGKAVAYPDILLRQVIHHFGVEAVEVFRFKGDIKIVPVNGVAGDVIEHDEFIFRTPAGEFAGIDHEGAGIGEGALSQFHGLPRERFRA